MLSGRLAPILFALGLALRGAPTSGYAETLPLPPRLIDFTSHDGETFLIESKAREDYFPLSIQFVTQKTPAYCGVASMVMVLNALNVPAPPTPDNQAFRTFTQDDVLDDGTDVVLPRDLLARQGMTLDQLGALLALHPVSVELLGRLKWFFGDLPPEARKALAAMGDSALPLWFVLLTFAIAPAICEEVAFRGFILSGLGRRGRVLLAVGLSSVAFGVMHMIPEQVFNASLMGLVLGTLAVRSGSILPCVVFHLLTNTLGVLHGRFGEVWYETTQMKAFFAFEGGMLRYRAPMLVVCIAIAAPLLWWLFRPLVTNESEANAASEPDERSPSADEAEPATRTKALAAHRE